MTYKDMIKIVEDLEKDIDAFEKGEIEDEWDEECSKNFYDRCDSQSIPANSQK